MEHRKLFLMLSIGFAFCLIVCAGCSSTTTGKEANSGNSTASESASTTDGTFSATIDGVAVSGGATDELQLKNTAFIYAPHDAVPQTILFDLLSDKKGDDFYAFRFSLPDKPGEYHATSDNFDQSHTFVSLDFDLKSSNIFARYRVDSFTVIIDKLSSSRVSGTFSGVMTLSNDTPSPSNKPKVTVLNGKFDIPFSTGNLRPQ